MSNIVELSLKPVLLYGFKEGTGILLATWNVEPPLREELSKAILEEINKSQENGLIIQNTLFFKDSFEYYKVL